MSKRALLLLCALLIAQLFGGCSSSSQVIRMDLEAPIENLDPQFTTDSAARMILMNIGEGLLTTGPDGELLPGAAERYATSSDGLTYTFTLRPGACWEDGTPVTAQDFLFAFTRMFSSGAPSPYARDFLMLKNAEAILAGSAAQSSLGVSAPDERTLVFDLEYPSAFFLEQLATPAALPCNQAVFEESRGRYGLELGHTPANGPFLLERWDNSRYLLLEPNEQYHDAQSVLPQRVTLYVGRENPVDQFLDGKSDLVLLPAERIDQVSGRRGVQIVPFERTAWCIVFQQEGGAWSSALLRQAMALTVDHTLLDDALASNYSPTRVFLPPAMGVGGQNYRAWAGDDSPLQFSPERGAYLLELGLSTAGMVSLPQATLMVPETGGHAAHIGMIQQGWQKHLGVHVSVEPAAPSLIESRLRSSGYQMLLMPFSPASAQPEALLNAFRSTSAQNYFGYRNERYDQMLEDARAQTNPEDAMRCYKLAEDMLLSDVVVLPVYFETTCYALAQDLTGVEILPFGGLIQFKYAQKG